VKDKDEDRDIWTVDEILAKIKENLEKINALYYPEAIQSNQENSKEAV